MEQAVILSACRTPIGRFLGSLSDIPATELGGLVVAEAISRAGIDGNEVDDVLMGNVLQTGLGQNVARQAAFAGGIPESCPATTVNMLCASGLKAVILASHAVATGAADVVVAGGMETMSQAPYLVHKGRRGYRLGDGVLVDSLMKDGLTCAFGEVHMGVTAENIAREYSVGRQDQDAYALESQKRARRALESGVLQRETIPVPTTTKGSSSPRLFDADEHPRSDITMEKLWTMRPAFVAGGTVTAGNSSGINDGAAALVIASQSYAERNELRPLAVIAGSAETGLSPDFMGMGPAYATRKLMGKLGLTIADIDLVEANEAFAAQTLAVARELELDLDRTNVNGGAIALGHPLGASGARILVTLLHAMEDHEADTGLATLCVGGGQGASMLVHRAA